MAEDATLTSQHPTKPIIPSDALPQHFMFRPRLRLIWLQVLIPLAILCGLAAVLFSIGKPLGTTKRTFIYVGMAVLAGATVAHVVWFIRSAPRVVVVCDQFLGITNRSGQQRRIPWSSIVLAQHSVKYLGMQWELDLIPAGRILLRDIGIAPERWGILRAIIIHCAGASLARGAAVFVDLISETVYPGQ